MDAEGGAAQAADGDRCYGAAAEGFSAAAAAVGTAESHSVAGSSPPSPTTPDAEACLGEEIRGRCQELVMFFATTQSSVPTQKSRTSVQNLLKIRR